MSATAAPKSVRYGPRYSRAPRSVKNVTASLRSSTSQYADVPPMPPGHFLSAGWKPTTTPGPRTNANSGFSNCTSTPKISAYQFAVNVHQHDGSAAMQRKVDRRLAPGARAAHGPRKTSGSNEMSTVSPRMDKRVWGALSQPLAGSSADTINLRLQGTKLKLELGAVLAF